MKVNVDELRKQKPPKSCVECPYGDHEAWCLIDEDWRERYYMPEDAVSENCPIWADHVKTVTAKTVINGNCCVCGKPLDNGLFLCKKCAAHTEGKL